MQHISHDPNNEFEVAIAIRSSGMVQRQLKQYYLDNMDSQKAVTFQLDYAGAKKPSAATRKTYSPKLLKAIDSLEIKYLLVADGEYFKTLTGMKKAEPYYGNALPCVLDGYEHITVVPVPNHGMLRYKPDIIDKIKLSIDALNRTMAGKYQDLGQDVVRFEEYPSTVDEIAAWLKKLHQYPALTCDVEAYSLKHYESFLGTVSFAWDEHSGIAFSVDTKTTSEPYEYDWWCKKDKKYKKRIGYHKPVVNKEVRALLVEFFSTYKGKMVYHNSGYDVTVLLYNLFMEDLIDQDGLHEGLEIMTPNMEDSLLVTYLATNSTTGNKLGLKDQAHEFAGNYAESDIDDIRLIEEPKLLRYNLVDTCATWYVMDKHYDTMVLDDQYDLYQEFLIYQKDLIQVQLTGMCLDKDEVLRAEKELQTIYDRALNALHGHPMVQIFEQSHRKALQEADWEKRKKSAKHPENIMIKDISAFDDVKFNPNSAPQLQHLLYEVMQLPVIDTTSTGQPATGVKILKRIIESINIPEHKEVLELLVEYSGVAKILSAFIPAFKAAPQAKDGAYYLFGSFRLGGTVSGRLSSSNPNLQQIPSGSSYAKVIKKCFIAPPNHIFVGADFASLEDRIDALLTKDPNKLKVYTDGYDGHCMRAYAYFKEMMPDIEDTVASINSIESKYKVLRQDSKAPTFALTYHGTWATLMNNLGWPKDKAQQVENNYLDLYKVSVQYKKDRIFQCSKDGYAVVAFGLRVRTPILAKSVYGSRATTSTAAAEGRTIGNAMGQSYGLLNNRAFKELMQEVRASKFKKMFRPCALIHDAIYGYVRDDWEALTYINNTLTKAMEWQELEEIAHPEVKLGGDLDVFYPTWKDDFTLPRHATVEQIQDACLTEMQKRAA